jgi:hypothetical protein
VLERIAVAGAAQARLRLVEDEQHPALVAAVAQLGEVAGRRDDHARAREDRLDDAGGEAAGRLRVDHREAQVELPPPVELAVGPGHVGAIRVGRRQREVAGGRGAVAAPTGGVRRAHRGLRHPVPRAAEGDDLVAAGDELGHPQRRLVGLRAGAEQERLLQGRRQALGEPPRQVDHRAAEHRAEQVIQRARGLAQRGHDRRVRVPEDRAHLARREIEQAPPVGRVQPAALRAIHDDRYERRVVAHDVAVDVVPELLIEALRGGERHGAHGMS